MKLLRILKKEAALDQLISCFFRGGGFIRCFQSYGRLLSLLFCRRIDCNRTMNKPFYGVASMPKSQRSAITGHNVDTPGPGSYDNLEKAQHGLPKWSLKKRLDQGSCFQNTSITPGPGNYSQAEGFKKMTETIISTKGQKYKSFAQKNYSHSSLNLPGSLNLKGGHSFGYRQPFQELEKSPGPIYHLDSIVEEKRTLKNDSRVKGFGGDKKNYIKDNNEPGPGSFEQYSKDAWKNKTCQAWSIGNAKRSESMPSTDLGPGEYSPKPVSTMSRSFKLRGRNEPKTIETSKLGPGSYDIPDTKMKIGTKFNVPKQNVYSDEDQPKPEELLSPSSYSPPRYLDKPTEHGFTLGKKLDGQTSGDPQEPGPGSYQISGSYIKGHGGYMGRKMQINKKQNFTMDNFYKYDPKISTVARQSPKFSFPQSKRYDKQNAQLNSYSQGFNQSLDKKPSGYYFSMGTSKRFADMKKENGAFRETTDYSSTGLLPNYLKKGLQKK